MANDVFTATDEIETRSPKTFWLKDTSLDKLKELQLIARNPDKVIGEIKKAIEQKIDELYEIRPNK
jgi:hypothetical protein